MDSVGGGWFRDKDEIKICQEGCQKKLEMPKEKCEDVEVKDDIALANARFSLQHPFKKIRRWKL